MPTLIELAKSLIAIPSVTPNDKGCQLLIADFLTACGFKCESHLIGDTHNLWARYGTKEPCLVFAGHTDVVPPGDSQHWRTPPFTPTIIANILYGRGACDMKAALAAMLIAARDFIQEIPTFNGSIAFLITSDEEGSGTNGTKKIVDLLQSRQEKINYCIIGEASSAKRLGDQIRIGRRGSLHGHLTVHGKGGHIAYPELTKNPIHLALAALDALAKTVWDAGNTHFPPTSFQISQIHSGIGALNVVPATLVADFNFRFSTASTAAELQARAREILTAHQLDFDLEWNLSGNPFLSTIGELSRATCNAIEKHTQQKPILSTGGGTSDGRFIASICSQVIELGPLNITAHQANECVDLSDLETLTEIYQSILQQLFSSNS